MNFVRQHNTGRHLTTPLIRFVKSFRNNDFCSPSIKSIRFLCQKIFSPQGPLNYLSVTLTPLPLPLPFPLSSRLQSDEPSVAPLTDYLE